MFMSSLQEEHNTILLPAPIPTFQLSIDSAFTPYLSSPALPQHQTNHTPEQSAHLQHSQSQPPISNYPIEKRPRKALTKEMIEQLNKLFTAFQKEANQHKFNLIEIAQKLSIGYSTILKKYQEFKAFSCVQEGQRLVNPAKIYKKSRLARSLIVRSLKQSSKLKNAREISYYVLERYGLYYKPSHINRQLRRMGLNKEKQQFYCAQNEEADKADQMYAQYLLQGLIELESNIVYQANYRFLLQNEEINVLLLASRQGAIIKVLNSDAIVQETIHSMIQQFTQQFQLASTNLWYLVTSEKDIISMPHYSEDQISTIFQRLLPLNPKIILLSSQCRAMSPIYRLYQRMANSINPTNLSISEVTKAFGDWLIHRQAEARSIIRQSEKELAKAALSSPY